MSDNTTLSIGSGGDVIRDVDRSGTFDGLVARQLSATSEFGKEYDSLADVVTFGCAPAVLVYAWGLQLLGNLGGAIAFLFLVSGMPAAQRPINEDLHPLDNKTVAIYKTTPQGDLKINLYLK